ncbi:hypothetical protein HYH03_004641 [Edaphochlamys debaryana]|uniref:cyclic pyranopterin monophosphate synthase n=1 Tax=Edaphochlamys debaryana TaxID=47281 RepID=A0A836C368_9CHLO|nr:hypothetical protein HYH03_004641 [Edaphochlamys debaryana]|eukprot:KAG2497488.1 hypothetical protein HYH03_004641 [Edaphochlamys debaryana]
MLALARALLSVHGQPLHAAKALAGPLVALRHSSTISDVAEANRELQEFFGVPPGAPASARGRSPTASPSRTRVFPAEDPGLMGSLADAASASFSAPFASPTHPPSPACSSTPDSTSGAPRTAPWGWAGGHAGAGGPGPSVEAEAGTAGADAGGEAGGGEPRLTHIDASGSASMVDVSQKEVTTREAQASCSVSLGAAYPLVAANAAGAGPGPGAGGRGKGDVLGVAQLAGICAAKATASLIPLCHNIFISKVDVQLSLDPASRSVHVRALARTDGKTGVEMEALTAASVAALTVYDMCKAAAKDMVISRLQLDYKSGGRSGTYLRAGLRRADLLPSARPPL